MSFLDEQASGQIGIGERANLSTLTRTRRKRKKGQNPTGAETYSLMPQNEFTNIVSSPTDIQQVGIGNLLTAQGASAADVQNVFERYKTTGAKPLGELGDVLYPQPEDDDDDDDDDDDEDLVTGSDPIPDADAGVDEPGNLNNPETPQSITAMSAMSQDLFSGLNLGIGKEIGLQASGLFSKGEMMPNVVSSLFDQAEKGTLADKDGNKISQEDIWSVFSQIDDTRAGGTGSKDTTYQNNDPGFTANFEGGGGSGTTGFGDATFEFGTGVGTSGTSGPASNAPAYSGDTNDPDPYSDPTGGADPSGMGDDPGDGGGGGGDGVAPGDIGNVGMLASGGTVKSKNKNSFMSMKGK